MDKQSYKAFVAEVWDGYCDQKSGYTVNADQQENLILAQSAPELLEACRQMYRVLENFAPDNQAMELAQQAINHAEGKA